MTMYRIFDAHTHSFPDSVATRAVPAMAEKAHIPYYHDGTFAGLADYEKEGGASGFLMLPIATRPGQAASINAWVRERADEMNARGVAVVPFGSVHPEDTGINTLLDNVAALGIKGIKLHPEYQTFYADETRMDGLYNAIIDRGMILCIHAGEDLGYPPPVRGDAERLARMLDRHPNGRFILAHMGGYRQWDAVLDVIAGREGVWLDTSFAAHYMERRMFRELVEKHGTQRILFGTDSPWASFKESLEAVTGAGLPEEAVRGILWDNAAALLGV